MTSEGQQHPGREPQEAAPGTGHGARTDEQSTGYPGERQSAPGNSWATFAPGVRPEQSAPWAPPAAPPVPGTPHTGAEQAPPAAGYRGEWSDRPTTYPPPGATPGAPPAHIPPGPRSAHPEPEPWTPEEAWGTGSRGAPGRPAEQSPHQRPLDEPPAGTPFAPAPEPATRTWAAQEQPPAEWDTGQREPGRFEAVRAAWREDAREQDPRAGGEPGQPASAWAPAEPDRQPWPAPESGSPWPPPGSVRPQSAPPQSAQPQVAWHQPAPAETARDLPPSGQFPPAGQVPPLGQVPPAGPVSGAPMPPATGAGQHAQPLGRPESGGYPAPSAGSDRFSQPLESGDGWQSAPAANGGWQPPPAAGPDPGWQPPPPAPAESAWQPQSAPTSGAGWRPAEPEPVGPDAPAQRDPGFQPGGPVPGFAPSGVMPLPPQEVRVPGATLAASPPADFESPSAYGQPPVYGQPPGYDQPSPYGQPPPAAQPGPGEPAEDPSVVAPVPHPRGAIDNPPSGRVSVPQPVAEETPADEPAQPGRAVSASASVPMSSLVTPPDHGVTPGPARPSTPRVYGRPVSADPVEEEPAPSAGTPFGTPAGAATDDDPGQGDGGAPAGAPWPGPNQAWSDEPRWPGTPPAREHANGFSHHGPAASAGSARVTPPPSAQPDPYAEPTGQFRGTNGAPYGDLIGSGPDGGQHDGPGGQPGPFGGPANQFPSGFAGAASAPLAHPGAPTETPGNGFPASPVSGGPVSGGPVSGGPMSGGPVSGAPASGGPGGFGAPDPYGQPFGGGYGQPAGPHGHQPGGLDQPAGPYGQPLAAAGQPGPGAPQDWQEQDRFNSFRPDAGAEAKPQQPAAEPAAEPVPQVRNGRVLIAVLAAAVLLVAIPLGLVWLLKPSDEAFNPNVGDCVVQSGDRPTSANCGDDGAFKVVSKVGTLQECANQQQWIDVPAAGDQGQQVLCLEPATSG
ncbi:hypothetical protein [Polymorphospora sp. NPDC050346]|uniref:hypothetical protein n=1 Tax=Polymorphospora sp. NPDC050346 TaxID=3155780 RepID=UPI0033C36D47